MTDEKGKKRDQEKKKRKTVYDEVISQLLLTMIPESLPC
jgi:hypothetical protein